MKIPRDLLNGYQRFRHHCYDESLYRQIAKGKHLRPDWDRGTFGEIGASPAIAA